MSMSRIITIPEPNVPAMRHYLEEHGWTVEERDDWVGGYRCSKGSSSSYQIKSAVEIQIARDIEALFEHRIPSSENERHIFLLSDEAADRILALAGNAEDDYIIDAFADGRLAVVQ